METYGQIIEEINELDEEDYPQEAYLIRRGIGRGNCDYNSSAYALDIAQRVRDAVGGYSAEWYQLDADENRVYVGDVVTSNFLADDYIVEGFKFESEGPIAVLSGGSQILMRTLHKVVPDSQKQIDADCDLSVQEYCKKHHINPCWTASLVRKHLLARQRKLDGVE